MTPAEILKEDYGIVTLKQLDKAIAELGFLDISIFCVERSKNNASKNTGNEFRRISQNKTVS